MNLCKITSNKNKYNPLHIICFIFLASVIFRSGLGLFTGEFETFFDELLHWNIAKSIRNGHGISFRGFNVTRYDIAYSLLISIAASVEDMELAHNLIMLLNAIMMSSVVFPTYILGKKLNLKEKYIYLICCIAISIPEMVYTASVLQENLMYPMAIWYFVFFIYLYDNSRSKLKGILLGLICFSLYLVKETALCFFVGTVLFLFTEMFDKKYISNNIKYFVFYCSSYLIPFIGYRFFIQKITFEETVVYTLSSVFDRILSSITDLQVILHLIYPFILYLVISIVLFGFFPIVSPFIQYKELSDTSKKIYKLILFTLFVYISVICTSITAIENYDSLSIRIHYRYYFFLLIPILIVFFTLIDKIKYNNFLLLFTFAFLAMLNQINIIPIHGSRIDSISLNFIHYAPKSTILEKTIFLLIVLLLLVGFFLIFANKLNIFKYTIILVFAFFSLINTYHGYSYLLTVKTAMENRKNDALVLDTYIDDKNPILLIGPYNTKLWFLESYFSSPYFVIPEDNLVNLVTKEDSLCGVSVAGFFRTYTINEQVNPKYIISEKPIYFQGYSEVDLGLKNYFIYTKNGDKIDYSSMPIIQNRYDDYWVNQSCEVIFYDTAPNNEISVMLEIDTFFEDNMEIVVQDTTGAQQTIIASPTKNTYTLQVRKNPNDTNYVIMLSTPNNYIPDNGDTRQLSFRLLDVKKINNN